MTDILFRASSFSKLMTEPKTLKEGPLSKGTKSFIREVAAQQILGVDFEFTSKETEKGNLCEGDSIALLNRVRGLSLEKNTERRRNEWVSGECDLFDPVSREGFDLKTSWSVKTFPILPADCEKVEYEYQARCYMALWDAPRWHIAYCLVDTPDHLIGYDPIQMHLVSHIPEHMRLTVWTIERDKDIEQAMWEKVRHARDYYRQVVAEFDKTHPCLEEVTA
jgi:hypothetical protein